MNIALISFTTSMRNLALFGIILNLCNSVHGQQRDSVATNSNCHWRVGLSGAFINGAELNTGSFEYLVGQAVYVSFAYPLSDRLFLSTSGGIEILTDESFYPLFGSFIVQPNPQKKLTLQLDLGHSFAEHSDYEKHSYYKFRGGRMTGVGISQFIQVGQNSMLNLGAKFRHQLTKLSYSSDSTNKIEENLNYVLLSLIVGLYF
jgi:hypothetical protein